MEAHNKIITHAVEEIFVPAGLFRIGSSRRWLYDGGYFFVQVEFQPYTLRRGTFCNVGISFLWELPNDRNDTLFFDYGWCRVPVLKNRRSNCEIKDFVGYQGDDVGFKRDCSFLATEALKKVHEYRRFTESSYAVRCMERTRNREIGDPGWWHYHTAMLLFLMGEYRKGLKVCEKMASSREEFYRYCCDRILPAMTDPVSARQTVIDMIVRRRRYFKSRPSYKKMSDTFTVPEP